MVFRHVREAKYQQSEMEKIVRVKTLRHEFARQHHAKVLVLPRTGQTLHRVQSRVVSVRRWEQETLHLNNQTVRIPWLKFVIVTSAVVQVILSPEKEMKHTFCNLTLSAIVVDGQWSPWSAWSTCTADCNGGQRTRTRQCNSPAPDCNGAPCDGPATQSEPCNTQPCTGITCTDGKVLSNCSNACDTTCSTLLCNGQCSEPERCQIGCVCPTGTVMDANGDCINASKCQCIYDGRTLLPGQTINVVEKCQEW